MTRPKTPKPAGDSKRASTKRSYLKQSDVPNASLEDGLRIPKAIFEHYAGKPTPPMQVAKALNVDPMGSQIRVLSGASIAFGLIEGGAQAAAISVTTLAAKILRPKSENDDVAAKREAVLRPRVFREFLERYDKHPFPREDIAINVLEEMGVPREKASEVLLRLQASANSVGLLSTIRDKIYVDLGGAVATPAANDKDETAGNAAESKSTDELDIDPVPIADPVVPQQRPISPGTTLSAAIADDVRRRKVFITHGKNRALVDPIKKLLEYGELEPVISVERQSVSKPVPEKFMSEMRQAGAAIIHVDAERVLKDDESNEHVLLNPNVLIEIGAAMAFYGRRFILLVRDGVKLPSNLQGLYEVRYKGEILDADATIRLLEAMKDMKNQPLPTGFIEK